MILDYTMILDYCSHFGDSERSDAVLFRRFFPLNPFASLPSRLYDSFSFTRLEGSQRTKYKEKYKGESIWT